jgi:hypothetical protein
MLAPRQRRQQKQAWGTYRPAQQGMRSALIALKAARNGVEAADRIIHSERDIGMSPDAVQVWFHRLYEASVRTRAVPRRRARPAGIRRQLALAAVR